MNSKLATLFLIISIAPVTFAGCGRTQDTVLSYVQITSTNTIGNMS